MKKNKHMLLEEAEEGWKLEKEEKEEKRRQEANIKIEARKKFLDRWYLISQRNQMDGYPIPDYGILGFLTGARICPLCRKKMISRLYTGGFIWRSREYRVGNDTDLSDELWKELFPYDNMEAVQPKIFKCEECGFEHAEENIKWEVGCGGVD